VKSDTEIYALLADADPVADTDALDTSALTARLESALGRGLATSPADLTRKEPTMVTHQEPDLETHTPTPPPRSRRGPLIAAATAVVIILAGVGIAFAAGVFDSDEPDSADLVTTTATVNTSALQVAEIADGAIGAYPAGRYRVDQLSPVTRFTIEDEWTVSDFAAPDDEGGFSGLRPEQLAAAEAEDPFVGIWAPITAWYDITTDTHVVFPPGELAARVEADPRLTDVAVTQVTVGSYPATRIEANVLDEYQTNKFWLGAGFPRDEGDVIGVLGGAISDEGDAAEHVVFWAINIDGADLIIHATYPTELADEFEPMLEALVASIEFE